MISLPAISIHDPQAIDAVRREQGVDPHRIGRMRMTFCKKFASAETAIQKLPAEAREAFAQQVEFHSLHLEQRLDSSSDGATKLIFLTAAQQRIEAVLLRAGTGRTTLCVSSQVGCAANCDFCATGKMGFQSNLTTAEILDQIVQAGQIATAEDRRIRNIVLMGMGEPFHNEEAVHSTIEALTAGGGFHHPASRLLISTVGIPAAMLRCARKFPAVNLALSLHSVRQEVRERIIPLARKYRVEELRETIAQLNALQPGTVMVEYLMLSGVNDSCDGENSDAAELSRFLEGLRVHVNLIPYNPIDDAPNLTASPREVRDRFATYLKQAGHPTTIRYSMGADIEAACGQLVQQIDRRKQASRSH